MGNWWVAEFAAPVSRCEEMEEEAKEVKIRATVISRMCVRLCVVDGTGRWNMAKRRRRGRPAEGSKTERG